MAFVLGSLSLLAGLLSFATGMAAGSDGISDRAVGRAATFSLVSLAVAIVAAYAAGRLA